MTSLAHADPSRPDDRLASDAAAHLARHPSLQLVAELLTRLREMEFPWWTPDQLRDAYPAAVRMRWFAERADIRQRITSQLTGLAARAARNKTPDFQASLVDSVIDESDISVEAFERAFEPADLATYGPAADFFRLFRRRMPWDDDSTPHQDLVGWFIGALLSDKSSLDGSPRQPVLSALQIRTAIDGRVWHSRIPLHVRVAIDDARFAAQRERPAEAYGVERDLAIATPALIAASIPLRDLLGVVDVASAALGFDEGSIPVSRAHARESATRSSAPRAEGEEGGPRAETERPERPPASLEEALEASGLDEPSWGSAPDIEFGESADLGLSGLAAALEPDGGGGDDEGDDDEVAGAAGDVEVPGDDSPRTAKRELTSRAAEFDELEHTNPWLVPNLAGELAAVAQELRAAGKRDERAADAKHAAERRDDPSSEDGDDG